MTEDKLKCFVIMPFSESSEDHDEKYWTNHFENFLKPEIEKVPNLNAQRSDELRADILKQIILNLYDSFIVVADLTDRNANVYWELGIRQSFKVKTITIAEEGTKLPFDVSTKSILFYHSNDPKGDKEFCKKFNEALIDCIENPEKSDSIVLDTLSVRDFAEDTNRSNNQKQIESSIEKLEKQKKIFEDLVKTSSPSGELEFRLIAYPMSPQNELFNREQFNEIKDHLKTKTYGPREIILEFQDIFRNLSPRRDGLYRVNTSDMYGGSVWISTEGFIFFHFMFNESRSKAYKNRLQTKILSLFLLGSFDFIDVFYSKFNSIKKINLEFMIWKLKELKFTRMTDYIRVDEKAYYRCENDTFDPYIISPIIKNLKEKEDKIKLVEDIISIVLLEFKYNEGFKIDPNILSQY
jgi:hypothetical protein